MKLNLNISFECSMTVIGEGIAPLLKAWILQHQSLDDDNSESPDARPWNPDLVEAYDIFPHLWRIGFWKRSPTHHIPQENIVEFHFYSNVPMQTLHEFPAWLASILGDISIESHPSWYLADVKKAVEALM